MSDARETLIADFRATRVSFTSFGTRKALSTEQRDEAAATFDAAGKFISAGKKLIDTKHKAYRNVTAIKSQARSFWKSITLPFPEDGVRLIREGYIPLFTNRVEMFSADLERAVAELDDQFYDLKQQARERLGQLYNSDDYPSTMIGLFSIEADFPNVDPPEYLKELNPQLYEQEKARIIGRFDEAVRLAEDAFTGEFAKLVSHLTDRLSGDDEGKPKEFRDTAVSNLREFFDRFRNISVRSNAQLDGLVDEAQRVVAGINPDSLRGSVDLRQRVATELSAVTSRLEGMMVDKPRRRLDRSPVK